MGHRLSAISTRTGDGGQTRLGDGSAVSKGDLRVAAMGDVDELNSAVGLLMAFGLPQGLGLENALAGVQQDLLDLGGELSIPGYALVNPQRVVALDDWLQALNVDLPRLQEFVRPGGSIQAAQAHMCRTICRRAERTLVELAELEAISPTGRQYLNRLSDLMFVLARTLNRYAGGVEPLWDRSRTA